MLLHEPAVPGPRAPALALSTNCEGQDPWVQDLPECEIVNRTEFITALATRRRVIHVGFTDAGCNEHRQTEGQWLHDSLSRVAGSLIGIDIDKEGVERARRSGYEAYRADCEDSDAIAALGIAPAQLVVAGEIIEHLACPGRFLRAMHELVDVEGDLVLTTPNACAFRSAIAALRGYEVAHPDHVGAFTYKVLATLLRRHGWRCTGVSTYSLPAPRLSMHPFRVGDLVSQLLLRAHVCLAPGRAPFSADGLIVVCRSVA